MINNIVNIKKLIVITIIFIIAFSVPAFGAEENNIYITTTRVNFREEPSTHAHIHKTLNAGTEIEMVEYAEDWSKIIYNGTEGYMTSEFIVAKADYAGQAELLEWSQVKNIIKLYEPIQVTDIRTGVIYYIQSFSNGKHADVETLTQEDTDKLLLTYNGKWQWDPRPVWVNINGRIIAASINGMPHGGGTISGNGMNGQVCLHFKGSATHNGNTKFTKDHQDGVMEAFNSR